MADLLIRNISEPAKKKLAIKAAQNGRSQQAEALSIIEEALNPAPKAWVDTLRETAEEVGGIEIPIIERHSPRITGAML